VLGVEPADEDRDGKSHYIRVKTTAKHADVRSRVQVFIPQKKCKHPSTTWLLKRAMQISPTPGPNGKQCVLTGNKAKDF